ncbi:unnamed protein product [Cuscuta epithymum]|uniref:Calmodulin-binding protein n=1 Tax=Cuscuta epithymum TaxID=186058 RepID=A0AAV0GAS1_9ASTE|nr:unnamed protein product [Cuscuta epithymum]
MEETDFFPDDIDSTCSTPYVSAPSSPGRPPPHSGFYYSAPTSPMHFVLSSCTMNSATSNYSDGSAAAGSSFEFDFSARLAADGVVCAGAMSSADELFFNGQIRPMKLSSHLQRPQVLAPLLDLEESEDTDLDHGNENDAGRGRDLKGRNRSLRRRTRSMSPLRTASFQWDEGYEENDEEEGKSSNEKNEKRNGVEAKESEDEGNFIETPSCNSGSSSRSSSIGRSSKRWVFLKEFLYRSKSEGRNNNNQKFWRALSFSSPVKEKKMGTAIKTPPINNGEASDVKKPKPVGKEARRKPVNGNSAGSGKRRVPPSPHELHYTANRAQAEEMRRKTFLPYRQGLLGCLGFSSKSYGAMNGLAKALNPVSSR